MEKILGEDNVITYRPANRIQPELENMRKEMNEFFEQEEDVLSYALFPGVATEYFKYRRAKKYGIDSEFTDFENKVTVV